MQGIAGGRIYGAAQHRTVRGTPFATARLCVPTGADPRCMAVVAFDPTAQAALLALDDGDAVSLVGTINVEARTARGRLSKSTVSMIATRVLTAYSAKRRRDAAAEVDA